MTPRLKTLNLTKTHCTKFHASISKSTIYHFKSTKFYHIFARFALTIPNFLTIKVLILVFLFWLSVSWMQLINGSCRDKVLLRSKGRDIHLPVLCKLFIYLYHYISSSHLPQYISGPYFIKARFHVLPAKSMTLWRSRLQKSLYLLTQKTNYSRARMPPKKKQEEKTISSLGRFGTSLKVGIVGLPNVGWELCFPQEVRTGMANRNTR